MNKRRFNAQDKKEHVMNKEMKSKGDVMVLKRSWLLRIIALSLVLLSSVAVTIARPANSTRAMMNTCPDVSVCLRQIQQKISRLRAYVRHVKPGDPVKFNPQPDPPGDPDPWYRQGIAAYKSLQEQLASLSESSPWGRSKWTWSQGQMDGWKSHLTEAQGKLNSLAQATDRNAATPLLDQLSASVQRLQNDLDNGRRSVGGRKRR
jgi:hypothetical protein